MKRNQNAQRSVSLLIIGLVALVVFAAPAPSRAASIGVGISVGIAPPPIPVYAQPVCPGTGFIWTPGYWAYDPVGGYYWVPGTWVMAPAVGLLWTPGYWGWGGAAFFWHAGYWGPHVGFYGGINYGFGYPGVGFVGGEWRGRDFFYNRSVNNFGGAHITNVYNRTVVNNFSVNRVSYNGGAGGLPARPTSGEMAAEHDRHMEGTSMQRQHEMAAHNERSQFASVNNGRPSVAATGRPGEFRGAGVVQASRAGGPVNPGGFQGAHNSNPAGSGFHGTNTAHTNSYSGSRSPNPGGGGTHQVMTAHQNSPAAHSFGGRPTGASPGQFHAAPAAPHTEVAHAAVPSHQAAARPQPQQHASPHPAAGGGHEPHGKGAGR